MAPFKFIERVFNGVPIQQYGDGNTSRDYTYIDDIVDGVVAAIDKPLGCEVAHSGFFFRDSCSRVETVLLCWPVWQVINLGNGRPFLLKDFISLVEKAVGKEAIIEVLPHQPGDVDRTCADITKAQELLGYSPKVPFEEGIRRTAEWFREATEAGLFDDETSIDATTCGLSAGGETAGTISRAGSQISLQSVVSEDTANENVDDNGTADTVVEPHSPSKQGIAEVRISPTRGNYHRGSCTAPYHHKRHVFIHKLSSDLELSSYVQKTPVQVRQRKNRILG
jgi:hypothetical protein